MIHSKTTLNCLSIDLGSNLGWVKSRITLQPKLKLDVTEHNTINLNKLTDIEMRNDFNNVYHRNRVKLTILEDILTKLTSRLKYDLYIVEDVFANPYRVAAFKSLLLMMDTLERIVNIKHGKRLHTIAPMAIKKIVADMGNADKMAVQEALLANEDITIRKPDLLTEHTSDAIGVAYAFSKKYLLNSI